VLDPGGVRRRARIPEGLRERGAQRAHGVRPERRRPARPQDEESTGAFLFSRPGKFRWIYLKPFEQLIVGDGEKVWVYDKDLEQVTVKKLGDALGNSPAALLAGDNDVDRAYTLKPQPAKGGLEWLEAVPKDPDSTFEKMRLGFRKSNPETIELHDRLGQITTIRFTKFVRNPKLAADTFRFTPPAGADVVGDK
jgi:outer membrane lipoprotein carrier protein